MRFFLLIALLFCGLNSQAQAGNDSLLANDSIRPRSDSLPNDTLAVVLPAPKDSIKIALQFPFASDSFLYRKRLFYSFTNPVRYTVSEKTWTGKDVIFYAVVALLLAFALIKNSFSRYLSDLFSSYFRTTVRQRQIKEQLQQSPLPSLLFNFFFLLSGSMFICLLVRHYALAESFPFWQLYIYSLAALTIVYGGKFLLLKFLGWVFQQSGTTDTYIFVIFSTNKVLSIFLLPFIILIAFTYGAANAAAITLSIILVGSLLLYRFFLSYISINQTIRISFFHFLLYLAAFEILPLLLINKLLFMFLREIS